MFFSRLTIFQNVIFLIAVLGLILLILYYILAISGFLKYRKMIYTDDIDTNTDNYDSFWGFLINAFKIRGSLLWLVSSCSLTFLLSIYIPIWIAILCGVVFGAGMTLFIGFMERPPLALDGETGEVSVAIDDADKMGKVILTNDNSEVNAKSLTGTIKKGKKVVIIENKDNYVIVQKIKR